jgi:plastocyanin
MKKRIAALLAACAAMALGVVYATPVAGGDVTISQAPPAKVRVLVRDNYFEPRSIEVQEGGHVGWKWRGENRHSIRFTKVPAGASRRGAKSRTEGYWKRSFRRPGVYRYVCRHWAGMRGTITVRSAPEPEPEQKG